MMLIVALLSKHEKTREVYYYNNRVAPAVHVSAVTARVVKYTTKRIHNCTCRIVCMYSGGIEIQHKIPVVIALHYL